MYQQNLVFPNVFTLEEVASYLKISTEIVEGLAQNGKIPGRKIEDSWRFLRAAIDDWLTGQSSKFFNVQQLPAPDKIRLLRVLVEELDTTAPNTLSPQLEFMCLPLSERHRIMAQQAEQMTAYYQQTTSERQFWQAGDFEDEYSA